MKSHRYTITINQPAAKVFAQLTDHEVFPQWVKAWGEGMMSEGEWKQGGQVSFFDRQHGGTKVDIQALVTNERIETQHIAVVDSNNRVVETMDDTLKKWIGSRENYYLTEISDEQTLLEVVMETDESFVDMMAVWPDALTLLKALCETQTKPDDTP